MEGCLGAWGEELEAAAGGRWVDEMKQLVGVGRGRGKGRTPTCKGQKREIHKEVPEIAAKGAGD